MNASRDARSLAGKRVVLTGAAGGIGRTIAARLGASGARLLLVDIDEERLAELAGQLHQHAITANLLVDRDRTLIRQWVSSEWEALDGLINCAGINGFGLQSAVTDQQLERVIAINLTAPILLTRKLLGLLERGRAPVIVNLGSVFGHIGYPGFSGYSASKFGLHGFSEALRRELADGPVRVAWISPRATRTAMNAGPVDQLNAELKVRYDEPDAVARAICAQLARPRPDRVLGFPEKFFARLNQVFPSLVDRSLRGQLAVIRKYSRQLHEDQST